MIPNDQPLRKQTIERMLNVLVRRCEDDECTEWERNFIQSVNDQFDIKSDLSNKQCEIIERLYDK
jgi:hypothetical protein